MSFGGVRLDLSRRSTAMGRWPGWALLALVGSLAVWRADQHGDLTDALDRLTAQRDVLSLRLDGMRPTTKGSLDPSVVSRLARAGPVIAHLALPWEGLFGAVEAADSRRLALLTLEPSARDASLRISGEAASMTDVMSYIDRLAQQPLLTNVHLASFETVQRDGAQVVTFGVQAKWRPH